MDTIELGPHYIHLHSVRKNVMNNQSMLFACAASQRRATSIPRHCPGSEYRWKELISEKKGVCESALYVLDIPVMQVAIRYTSWPPSPVL